MKKMGFLLTAIAASLIVIILAPACTSKPSAPAEIQGQTYTLKFAVGSGTLYSVGYGPFEETIAELDKETGGRIKIVVYETGEHPYTKADMHTVMRDRLFDMGETMPNYLAGIEPIITLFDLPLLFSNAEEIMDLYNSKDYKYLFDKVIHEPLAKYNATVLVEAPFIGYGIGLDRFVDSWDALKGKKIRTYGPEMQEMIKILNGTPVSLAWTDVYPGLQSKLIDGWCTNLDSARRVALFEITKYYTYMDFQAGIHWIMINNDSLNQLPPDLRKIFDGKMAEFNAFYKQWMVDVDKTARASVETKWQVQWIYMPEQLRAEAREKMKPVWQQWAQNAGGEATQLLADLEEYHTKWLESR